jgi:hypothetical protein
MEERDLSRRQKRHLNQELGQRKPQYSQRSRHSSIIFSRIGEPNNLYTNCDTLIEYIALLDVLQSTVTANIGKKADSKVLF